MTNRLSALVLDGGSGQSLAVARSLGAAGWRIVTVAGSRTSRSRFTATSVSLPRDSDAAAYGAALCRIVRDQKIDLVVPTNDWTLELCWAAAPGLGDARILGGDRRSVATFLDKVAGIAAARRHGFPVPRTVVADRADLVPAAAAEIGFPCVVKPRRSFVPHATGTRHLRHVVVRSPADAAVAARRLSDRNGTPPLVQALVSGRAIAATFVIRQGRTLARAARETLSFWPVAGGFSVWKRSVALETPGVAEAERFLLSFGFEGLAEVEYVLDSSGSPRLMEVGPRAHGWIPLAEAACPGLIEAASMAAVGREPGAVGEYRAGIEMRWILGELLRLRLAVRASPSLPVTVTRRQILRSLWPPWKPGMRYDIIDLHDPLPWAPSMVGGLLRRAHAWTSRRPPARRSE